MPGPHKGYTTPHKCATVSNSKRNQPSDRDGQARRKLQEKASGFHANFDGLIYLSIGSEAKRDIYNTFDPDRSISIHLDPPSTERPLVEIKQEGKNSICTTNFYFRNKSPSNIVVVPLSQNNTTPTGDKAAAADHTVFDTDPLQPGEIHLHSWMLCTSQAPILDLTGEDIKSMKDIDHAFHTLKTMKIYLMAEKKQEPINSSKSLTDSDTSDDTEVNPTLRTSVGERKYDTIPGSVIATRIALSHSMAQANLMVERGRLLQKAKIKKLPKDKDKATQTKPKDKKSK